MNSPADHAAEPPAAPLQHAGERKRAPCVSSSTLPLRREQGESRLERAGTFENFVDASFKPKIFLVRGQLFSPQAGVYLCEPKNFPGPPPPFFFFFVKGGAFSLGDFGSPFFPWGGAAAVSAAV